MKLIAAVMIGATCYGAFPNRRLNRWAKMASNVSNYSPPSSSYRSRTYSRISTGSSNWEPSAPSLGDARTAYDLS